VSEKVLNRRQFLCATGAALAAAPGLSGQPKRRLRIGHTGITWGFKPDDAPGAIRDVSALGYEGYETFGEYLDAWELKGGFKQVLDEAHLPLVSAYCNVNLTDPTKRADETAKIVRWAKLIQKCGGTTAVVGPNGVRRNTYDFKAAKADIITSLNEMCKAVADTGAVAVLHQHTGTCIESRDEVYAIMDAVDTDGGDRRGAGGGAQRGPRPRPHDRGRGRRAARGGAGGADHVDAGHREPAHLDRGHLG
jgi:inosose dehydratase